MRVKLPSLTLDPEGARRAEGVDTTLNPKQFSSPSSFFLTQNPQNSQNLPVLGSLVYAGAGIRRFCRRLRHDCHAGCSVHRSPLTVYLFCFLFSSSRSLLRSLAVFFLSPFCFTSTCGFCCMTGMPSTSHACSTSHPARTFMGLGK